MEVETELNPAMKLRFAEARRKVAERKEAEKVERPKMTDYLPSGLLEAAKARLAENGGKISENEFYVEDENGAAFYRLTEEEIRIKNAIDFHGNDSDIRFDDCEFPKNREDRRFALKYEFVDTLKPAMKALKTRKWVFAWGGPGTGKTSLAIRLCWEIMKRRPTLRPSFLSMNEWINSNMPDEEKRPLEDLRRLVVLDDFDQFDFTSEFQTRCCLRLLKKLWKDDHGVIITANSSVVDLSGNGRHMNFDLCLDRIRGQSVAIEFKGESKR